MNVEDFVATSLEQIIAGVRRAQNAVEEHGASVNPAIESGPAGRVHFGSSTLLQDIEFDIAVSVADNAKSGANLKVGIPWVGGGVDGGSERHNSAVSRIRFRVPIVLP